MPILMSACHAAASAAARYLAGLLAFLAAGLALAAGGLWGSGAVLKNLRAMSSIVKGDGSSCLAGLG